MVDQTWELRELPILEAIFHAEEGSEDVGWGDIADRTGLDVAATRRAVRALHEGGYIMGIEAPTFDGYDLLDIRLLPKGRKAIGQWPSEDAFRTLLALLEAQIAEESNEQRKTKLRSLRDAVRDVGVEVAGTILASLVRQSTGL